MNRYIILLVALCSSLVSQAFAESFSVKSPDSKLEAIVNDESSLTIEIKADGKTVLAPFPIAMKTDKGIFGVDSKAKGKTFTSEKKDIKAVYGIRSVVEDKYNQIEIDFDKFRLIVRAYDESIAYRFVYSENSEIIVFDETLNLPLDKNDKIIGHAVNAVQESFERNFLRQTVADMSKHHSYSLPFLFSKDGYTVAVVESDVLDYPALRFTSGAKAMFSKVPASFKQQRYYIRMADKEYDYIAKTKGSRNFPWRAFIIARKDIDLADNDTVYKLAEKSRISDTSWITPGTCAWEWWSNRNLEGVGFVGGVNNETYYYYVDFAAENNIPYLLIDDGWLTEKTSNITAKEIDEAAISGKSFVDIPSIIKYAHTKNVKIILWCVGQSMDKYGERIFEIIKNWGADGVKIDFTDRDDQQASQFYERMARLAAKHQMVIDFHGCSKPAGLQRTYPNVLNFEAVRGCEFYKFLSGRHMSPSHDVDLVFTRMLQGPMDYTPGALRNMTKEDYQHSYSFPQAKGTRSHMVSMYVLYYAPLQMLCDSATEYKKYPDILKFIANAPTSWDETVTLEGKIGEYVVVARRKGDSWYVGGMNDWTARDVSINLSKILHKDKSYNAEIIRDTENSNKLALDYTREIKEVSSDTNLKIRMEQGGGFAIKITPQRISIIDDIIELFL